MRHSGKEYSYVLSGRLGVCIGFDEHELRPGMAISFDASAPHRLWAIGEEPAETIWLVVGRHYDSRRSHAVNPQESPLDGSHTRPSTSTLKFSTRRMQDDRRQPAR